MQCILSNLREKRFEMLIDLTNRYRLQTDSYREKKLLTAMSATPYKLRMCKGGEKNQIQARKEP